MTTVATMTTKPAKAEPMMRGSWSCTERSGSSATDEETGDKIQTSAALPKRQIFYIIVTFIKRMKNSGPKATLQYRSQNNNL